jgi:hypothetical protein
MPVNNFNSLLIFEQNDIVGSRAAGLGNAFTATVSDVSAMKWNPAALTKTGDLSFWISGQSSSGNLMPLDYNGKSFIDWRIERQSKTQIKYFGAVFRWSPFKENVRIGFGIGQQKGYPERESHFVNTRNSINYSWVFILNSGVKNSFTAAMSVDLTDNLFLGCAIDFWSTETEKTAFDRRSSLSTVNKFDTLQTRILNSFTSFNLGILYTGINNLDIGLNLHMPYDVELRPENINYRLGQAKQGSVDYLYNFIIKFPLSFTTGIFYRLLPNIGIAIDYVYKPWSQIVIKNAVLKKPEFNLHSVHFGLEYILNMNTIQIPLRSGFYTKPTLIKEESGRQLILNTFTLGAGLIYNKLHFDISLEWVPISYKVASYKFDPEYALDNVSFEGDFIRVMMDLGIALDYR